MEKFAMIHRQTRDSELVRKQAARKEAGLAPITVPDSDGTVNLSAQIESNKVYKDKVVEVDVDGGMHPFGNNANNMRVAQRIASESETTAKAPVVLSPQQAAKQALAKAAAFEAANPNTDDEDETNEPTAPVGTNTVLQPLTPQQKAAATRAANAAPAQTAPPVPTENGAPPLPPQFNG